MIRKQLYTIESTLKPNLLINYNRFLVNNRRASVIYNRERDDNLTESHLQTENFDKYYDTKFIGLTIFRKFSDTILGTDDDEDDYDF
jgi:hypothetical protein